MSSGHSVGEAASFIRHSEAATDAITPTPRAFPINGDPSPYAWKLAFQSLRDSIREELGQAEARIAADGQSLGDGDGGAVARL